MVLQEGGTTRSFVNRICKCQATFFGHVMRKEKLEHLVTTGMSEKMWDGFNKVAQSRKSDRSTESEEG